MTNEKPVYLSKLVLNPKSKEVQNDLADCQKMHCRVMSAFPKLEEGEEKKAREKFGVLYRVDITKRKDSATVALLVQSQLEPNWSNLPDNYLVNGFDAFLNLAVKQVNEIYCHLQFGDKLRFRLRANPTRKIDTKSIDGKRRNGKRVELRSEEARIDWLQRKGKINEAGDRQEGGGFRLCAVRVKDDVPNLYLRPESNAIGRRKDSDGLMKFASVLFEGELEITDTEAFLAALTNGIGSGKAYGFGLLSIAPIPQ